MGDKVIVVGAGLAGLVCARWLHRWGIDVTIVEASDGVGGRVRTDVVDGFRLDRGFQVYFSAYPAGKRELNLSSLNLQRMEAGSLIFDGKSFKEFGKAYPLSDSITWGDKLNLLGWIAELQMTSPDDIWKANDIPIGLSLKKRGFSNKFIENFARPFFGGVFMDRDLITSSNLVNYIWKILEEGDTTIPALGIGEIAQQIANDLPDSCIHLNCTVLEIQEEPLGVKLANGQTLLCDNIVIATEGAIADALLGRETAFSPKSSTTVYYEVPEPPVLKKLLVLNAQKDSFINEIMPCSVLTPRCAPYNRHFISVTAIDAPRMEPVELDKKCRADVQKWFPKARPAEWKFLKHYYIPHTSFTMAPGFQAHRPHYEVNGKNIYQAGEFTHYCSTDGAMQSGYEVAKILRRKLVG